MLTKIHLKQVLEREHDEHDPESQVALTRHFYPVSRGCRHHGVWNSTLNEILTECVKACSSFRTLMAHARHSDVPVRDDVLRKYDGSGRIIIYLEANGAAVQASA